MHVKQLITFNVLFVLSIFRPAGLGDGLNLPVGPLAVVAATIMFLAKVHSPSQLHAFFNRFKTSLVLIVGYTVLCLVSLFFNYHRYEDIGEFLRWGLVFIIGQSFLPLCTFLFLMPDNAAETKKVWSMTIQTVTVFTVLLIPAVVLVQLYIPEIFPLVVKYFVGGDGLEIRWFNSVRGVLATSTDLGAVSGIICFVSIALAAQSPRQSKSNITLLVLCAMLFALVGALSESRNFFLFFAIASLTILVTSMWARNKLYVVGALPMFLTMCYASAYVLPNRLASKIGKNIPHFANVSEGTDTSIAELLPVLSFDSLGPRGHLWQSAVMSIAENPILGMSNGGFRLAENCACARGNTHNIVLQGAIDAGILGAMIICLLFVYILKKNAHDKWSLAFILAVISTLMVDNFTDHSFAWMVVVAFAGVILHRKNLHNSA